MVGANGASIWLTANQQAVQHTSGFVILTGAYHTGAVQLTAPSSWTPLNSNVQLYRRT